MTSYTKMDIPNADGVKIASIMQLEFMRNIFLCKICDVYPK